MIQKIQRNYLEINSLHELVETNNPSNEFVVNLLYPANYQLNKFFYKNVGRKHNWVDRLSWSEKEWIKYTTDNWL